MNEEAWGSVVEEGCVLVGAVPDGVVEVVKWAANRLQTEGSPTAHQPEGAASGTYLPAPV